MSRALFATVTITAGLLGRIIEHQEVAWEPLRGIVVDECCIKNREKVLQSHIEETVALVKWNVSLLDLLMGPCTITVRPLTSVHVFSPWISEKNESFSASELLCAENDI